MAIPKVTIIGRPNVGKSSLLNVLAGHMISIVEPTAGVTRDRISTVIESQGKFFELVDTGGVGIVDADELSEHVEKQIRLAITTADLVLFMVDIRDGIVPLDKKIAKMLRKEDLNIIGVANKADSAKMFPEAGEFSKLGFGDFLCISATNNLNKSLLLEKIVERLGDSGSEKPAETIMKVAIVGKRNAGKSTLVNAIAGDDRVIVSEVPGTTRDAVDVTIEKDGQSIIVIDTAGVRKKGKMQGNIEFYSYVRATKSIKRADVVLLMIEATVPISKVDKKLAGFITNEYKSCIIVINKWDMAKDTASTDEFADYLTRLLPGLRHAPIVFTTAKDGRNIQSLLDLTANIYKQATTNIATPVLNSAFGKINNEKIGAPGTKRLGFPKIYYAAQIDTNPITILMFVNKPKLFEENYQRFIINRLRDYLPIAEVPIKLLAKKHRT